MKARLTLMAIALLMCILQLSAQYCGNSGSTVCTSPGTLPYTGYLASEDIPCIVRGQQTDLVIPFQVPASYFYGITYVINTMRIDSISQLPEGLCWASSKSDNKFASLEHGCLKISGITQAPAGQYRLYIENTLNLVDWGDSHNSAEGFLGTTVFLRVVNSPTNICLPPDTTKWGFIPNNNPDNFSKVEGKVYRDANTNNVYDAGELGLANIRVDIGGISALTNVDGDYHAFVPVGTHVVTPEVPTNGAIAYTVANSSVTISADGLLYADNNFAATVDPTYCEANLVIVPQGPLRPGFENRVDINFTNSLSIGPLSQTIRLNYPPTQTYLSSSITPTNIDNVNHFLEWQVSSVSMGSTWTSILQFETPANEPMGSVLEYKASINNASCTKLDTLVAVRNVQVVGSYDPNDKTVSPVGHGINYGVNPNENPVFTYKVRFQNTGTYLAENVIITDTISQHLNLSTIKVQAASHSYEVTINGRVVSFWFKGIMLADSNTNEPESHGYIQYIIRPNTGLVQNTVVANNADIYFDFNKPIRTNTAFNTIDYNAQVGITEVLNDYTFTMFPNPANGSVHIQADAELIGKDLQLTDISGRVMLHQTITETTTTLNVSNIAKGIYLVRMGATTRKLVHE